MGAPYLRDMDILGCPKRHACGFKRGFPGLRQGGYRRTYGDCRGNVVEIVAPILNKADVESLIVNGQGIVVATARELVATGPRLRHVLWNQVQ